MQDPSTRVGSTKVGLLKHAVFELNTTTKNCNGTLLSASIDPVELKSSICTATPYQPIRVAEYDTVHSL